MFLIAQLISNLLKKKLHSNRLRVKSYPVNIFLLFNSYQTFNARLIPAHMHMYNDSNHCSHLIQLQSKGQVKPPSRYYHGIILATGL